MLSLNLFKRTTKDLLFVYNAIKPPMIYDNITTNVGTIDSKGLEWEMNWLPVRTKNFQYSASLTGSLLSSTLKSLSNNQFKLGYTYLYDLPTPGLPGPAIRLEEGKPIGSFSVGAMPEPTPRVISWYGAKTGERSRPRNEPRKTRILSATAYRKCSSLSAIRLLGRILIYDCFSPLGWGTTC